MVFEMVSDSLQPTIYDFKVELADLTASTAAQNMLKKYSKFKLTVYVKAYTSGSPTFRLEIADDIGFTTNVRNVATLFTASVDESSGVFEGVAPKGGQQFARVLLQAGVLTYDARIEAGL